MKEYTWAGEEEMVALPLSLVIAVAVILVVLLSTLCCFCCCCIYFQPRMRKSRNQINPTQRAVNSHNNLQRTKSEYPYSRGQNKNQILRAASHTPSKREQNSELILTPDFISNISKKRSEVKLVFDPENPGRVSVMQRAVPNESARRKVVIPSALQK